MTMKSLHIQIDEKLYEQVKLMSFVEKKPMASFVRELLKGAVDKNKETTKEKVALVLEADDDAFEEAMKNSFDRHEEVYRKLAQ